MTPETQAAVQSVAETLTRLAGLIRDESRAIIVEQDHVALIKHYDALRRVNDTIKFAREALSELEDSISRTDIPELFDYLLETTGQKPPFTIEGVGRVSVTRRFSASMIDKEKGLEWLRANGHEGLIQETVNSSTLAAFAKDMQENQGKDLPIEIFKVGTMRYTSITKK